MQALYMGRQWRRALALLRDAGLIEADVRGRYLAARCLMEVCGAPVHADARKAARGSVPRTQPRAWLPWGVCR